MSNESILILVSVFLFISVIFLIINRTGLQNEINSLNKVSEINNGEIESLNRLIKNQDELIKNQDILVENQDELIKNYTELKDSLEIVIDEKDNMIKLLEKQLTISNTEKKTQFKLIEKLSTK